MPVYLRSLLITVLLSCSATLPACRSLDLSLPIHRDRSFASLPWDQALAAKLRRDDSKIRTWKSEYDEAIRENDRDSARLLRDRVVYAQMALVREYHDVYIQDRFHGADLSSDAIEVATLGTSAAATVVGGIPTKAALAGASTILGAVKSPLLNGFSRLRITEAILSRMEKNRHRAHEALVSRLRNEGVDTCPLEAAELDCIDYFYSLSADRAVADIMFAED